VRRRRSTFCVFFVQERLVFAKERLVVIERYDGLRDGTFRLEWRFYDGREGLVQAKINVQHFQISLDSLFAVTSRRNKDSVVFQDGNAVLEFHIEQPVLDVLHQNVGVNVFLRRCVHKRCSVIQAYLAKIKLDVIE